MTEISKLFLTLNVDCMIARLLDKTVQFKIELKINFLIYQTNHMSWVLK